MKVRKGLNRKMVAGRKKKKEGGGEKREKGETEGSGRGGGRDGCKEGEGGKPSPVPFFLSFSFLYRHMFFLSFF